MLATKFKKKRTVFQKMNFNVLN